MLQPNSERNVAEELEEAISSGKFNPAADVTSPGGSTADSGGPTEQSQVTILRQASVVHIGNRLKIGHRFMMSYMPKFFTRSSN